MLRLAVEMAKDRITSLLAVICAVLGAAALLTATGVLAESGLRSHLPPGRLGGADIVVSADQTFHPAGDLPIALPERGTVPARLAGELGGVPGVTASVADTAFPAGLVDAHGRAVAVSDARTAGHGWSSLKLLQDPKVEGTKPTGSSQVAVESAIAAAAGVGPGDTIRVVAAGRSSDYRLTAVVDAADAGILFSDQAAARLAGRDNGPKAGTADLIGLRTAPGAADKVADDVRDVLRGTGLVVATGAERGDLAAPDAVAARSLLILLAGSLAGIILLITGFVIAGALGVSIAGQRRALALMRAVGATPKQIRRLAADQASVVAAVALVPGAGLGYLLAGEFRSRLADSGLLPQALPLAISPLPAIATGVLLMLAVQVSARGAARRTSRLPATEAVTESRSEPTAPSRLRTGAGLLLVAAATTLSVTPLLSRTALGASTTSLAGIVGAIGLAMAGPALIRRVGETLARRLRPGASAATWLAVSNIRGYALRIAGIVSALAMMTAFLLTYTFAQTTLQVASAQDVRTGTLAQHRLSAPGVGGLPEGTLTAVRKTAGVEAAVPVSSTTAIWSFEELGDPAVESASAMILTPEASAVLDLGLSSGTLSRLTGDTVAIGSDVARSRGAEVGDRVRLILGDGTRVSPRVVAVYTRGLGFGPVVLSHDLARGHTTTGLDQSILVRTDGTAAADERLAALDATHPGLALEPASADASYSLSDAPPEVWINLATIAILLGYLLLSVANKIVAATAQRRNEIATLRLTGTTPRQIRTMMRREAAMIAVASLTAGLVLSAVPLALLGVGFLDRPWPSGPVWLLPALAVTVVSVAFLSTELPTRRTLRTTPAHALSDRG
ncbi:FtsX-like permease family protein [Streptomyces sp. NPDC048669]|uniref:FtsX-like permease family protein n=1 Tax=Streptomyces sp. NPDC048669 TaxID=3155267 RepID=UPI003412AECE